MNTEIPGDLIVSEDVLADIAGHAALQCYGVVGMAVPSANTGLAKLLPRSPLRKGVVVSADEDGVLISLYVVLEHGVNINAVSTNLVDQVTFALEEFLQSPLKGIDVHVQGIKVR
ncbi:Asp23/Gls24 family envelope stress response protein [Anaerotardibacter muris]|uniref:Asp23/Gls24 family envelope stress response protein n=1 Tax=Anaerotardibacter muris TaxID=2941505 RepID=UPI0020423B8A|nr:Asp23/Gls24 family envelope stress response protein [Anaerotardibacter muris]